MTRTGRSTRPTSLAIALFFLVCLGQPSSAAASDPIQVNTISVGGYHSCAIRESGQVVCWGAGALPDGGSSLTPVPVSGLTDAVAISAGDEYTCAIRESGQAVCWGANESGQLGDGTETQRLTPTNVSGLTDAVSISASASFATPDLGVHTCAIREHGQAVCWGSDKNGQLGDGMSGFGVKSLTPTNVSGLTDAVEISAGEYNTCAIRDPGLAVGGQAVCWGDNYDGEVGDGTKENERLTPTNVSGLTDATAISAGLDNACAIRESGQAVCWGDNFDGKLGDGTEETRLTPTNVSGLTDATAISSGGSLHTCAIRNLGQAVCWGGNNYGQIGDGTEETRLTPTNVSGLTVATAISAGGTHTCAIGELGQAVCWGDNVAGDLGDCTETKRLVPIAVVEGCGGSPPIETCATNAALCPPAEQHPASQPNAGGPQAQGGKQAANTGGQCVANADAAFRKATKAAKHKHGKARAKALKKARELRAKHVFACKK